MKQRKNIVAEHVQNGTKDSPNVPNAVITIGRVIGGLRLTLGNPNINVRREKVM